MIIPDRLPSSPYFQIPNLLHLLLILLTVVGLRIEVKGSLGLFAVLDTVV